MVGCWVPLLENKKGFLVSKFQSFRVSNFQSFNISKFQSSTVPKFQSFKASTFQKKTIFLITNFQDVWDTHFRNFQNTNCQISRNSVFEMIWDLSSIILNVLVSPKIKIIGSGAQGHVQKSRNHENEGFEGSHITKSKSYKSKMK